MRPCDVCFDFTALLKSCPLVSLGLPSTFLLLLLLFLSFFIFIALCLHLSLLQTLMSVALGPSPAAPHLTASTRWDPTCARGR